MVCTLQMHVCVVCNEHAASSGKLTMLCSHMTVSLYNGIPTCCLKRLGYRQCVSLLHFSGTLARTKDSTKAADLCPASKRPLKPRRTRFTDHSNMELYALPAMFATSTGDNVTDFCHGVVPSFPSAETFATVMPLLY